MRAWITALQARSKAEDLPAPSGLVYLPIRASHAKICPLVSDFLSCIRTTMDQIPSLPPYPQPLGLFPQFITDRCQSLVLKEKVAALVSCFDVC